MMHGPSLIGRVAAMLLAKPRSWRSPTPRSTGGNQSRPIYIVKRIDHYRDCRGARRQIRVLEGHSQTRTYRAHPDRWYRLRKHGQIGEPGTVSAPAGLHSWRL